MLPSAVLQLLPTPRATRGGSSTETSALLPTPSVADATGGHERRGGGRGGELLLKGIASHEQFGKYAPAIARHEQAFGLTAPDPTETGPSGNQRLSAAFSEFMMGLPAGWVTDVPGMRRNWMLHALGNGVVPQQAAAALRLCLERFGFAEEVAACCRPGCDYYQGGLPDKPHAQAAAIGHDKTHDRKEQP